MYQRTVAILLILCLSYQSFVKLGVVIWYQVNKEYVAQNLCENRDKPEMNCCGKCYLRKQLKKVETNNTGTNIPQKWNFGEVMMYTVPDLIYIKPLLFSDDLCFVAIDDFLAPLLVSSDIFHPPSLA